MDWNPMHSPWVAALLGHGLSAAAGSAVTVALGHPNIVLSAVPADYQGIATIALSLLAAIVAKVGYNGAMASDPNKAGA